MTVMKVAAFVGIGLIFAAAPAAAGPGIPPWIKPASDIQQIQFRGDDVAGAIIGGAIAGALGGALGGSCYYNDCDDDHEGFYGGGFYGGPGYYGDGGFYHGGPRYYGGRTYYGGGRALVRGGGGRAGGGHMAGRR